MGVERVRCIEHLPVGAGVNVDASSAQLVAYEIAVIAPTAGVAMERHILGQKTRGFERAA
jgi:hypothetical protein